MLFKEAQQFISEQVNEFNKAYSVTDILFHVSFWSFDYSALFSYTNRVVVSVPLELRIDLDWNYSALRQQVKCKLLETLISPVVGMSHFESGAVKILSDSVKALALYLDCRNYNFSPRAKSWEEDLRPCAFYPGNSCAACVDYNPHTVFNILDITCEPYRVTYDKYLYNVWIVGDKTEYKHYIYKGLAMLEQRYGTVPSPRYRYFVGNREQCHLAINGCVDSKAVSTLLKSDDYEDVYFFGAE